MICKRHLFFALAMMGFMLVSGENAAVRTRRDLQRLGLASHECSGARILPTGEIKFADLFQAAGHARKYILMDYFKFQQDSICGVLLDILCRKAREGVKVCVLFDAFGNQSSEYPLSDTLQARIRQSGVQIKAFDPVRFPWINHLMHRDHHKIAVVDGEVVYTGGMNVADYYLHGKPKVGRWRDMHIRMSGPIVAAYEELFWKMWNKETEGSKLKVESRESTHPSSEDAESPAPSSQLPAPSSQLSTFPVVFASRWPRETPAVMRRAYCVCIDNADSLVQIVNPYAMLFGEVRTSLRKALERGVKVQVMVSTRSDGKVNDDVIGLEMRKLMKRGAEVWYYDDGFHHSKVMMIDGLFCTVGTTNLDARSLCFDYEVNSFIFDTATTAALRQIFEDDVANHCTLLTPEVWRRRFPAARRVRSRIFTLAKRFM